MSTDDDCPLWKINKLWPFSRRKSRIHWRRLLTEYHRVFYASKEAFVFSGWEHPRCTDQRGYLWGTHFNHFHLSAILIIFIAVPRNLCFDCVHEISVESEKEAYCSIIYGELFARSPTNDFEKKNIFSYSKIAEFESECGLPENHLQFDTRQAESQRLTKWFCELRTKKYKSSFQGHSEQCSKINRFFSCLSKFYNENTLLFDFGQFMCRKWLNCVRIFCDLFVVWAKLKFYGNFTMLWFRSGFDSWQIVVVCVSLSIAEPAPSGLFAVAVCFLCTSGATHTVLPVDVVQFLLCTDTCERMHIKTIERSYIIGRK